MKKNTNSNKLIKTNKESIPSIRKTNTRNITTSIKKKFQSTKKKYFSMSSNEDIINKNKFKKNTINNELNFFNKNGDMQKVSHTIANPSSLPHNIFFKFKKKFVTEKNTPVKDRKNEKINLFKKNKFKKTIIIDGEGNNNLNINNGFSINDKMPFLNVKKNNKFAIKPIVRLKSNRNSVRMRNRNYAIKSLINHFKNIKNSDTITSTFTETNSLFMNSNTNRKKIANNEVIGKEDSKYKYRVNEYNKIIDILKVNITDAQKMINEKKSNYEIKEISDYNTFAKNVERLKNINKMASISNSNSNNIKESTSELISFLESSIKDEFYQTLLIAKAKNKNSNDDSFNLSQSTSEFENTSKGYEEEKCKFDHYIQLPNKNDIKIFPINSLNKFFNENKNKSDKLCNYNIKGNIKEARNDVCIIF